MLSNATPPCDVGVLRGAPDTPGCASYAKHWVLATTVFGSSIAFIEASVINVALPAIQETYGATVTEMQWVASGYTVLLAALTLTGGADALDGARGDQMAAVRGAAGRGGRGGENDEPE